MSLPASTVEQLRKDPLAQEQQELNTLRRRARELAEANKFLEIRNGELLNTIEKQKETIRTLEVNHDALSRRLHVLEQERK